MMAETLSIPYMPYRHINFEAGEDGIALLTIARPQKLNALNAAMMTELDDAVAVYESNPAMRGLLVTGEGEKAFAAGADIGELLGAEPARAADLSAYGQRIFLRVENSGKPSIAALNGFALGGGLELAMACTLRVAATSARLGQPEVRLGIIPGYGATQRLPRLIGPARALELLLTGEPVTAEEAHRIGLVNHVVAPEQLIEFSRTLLRKILANGPQALRLTMQAVATGLSCGLQNGMQFEANAFGLAASTRDCREGVQAFLEKRTPVFTGN